MSRRSRLRAASIVSLSLAAILAITGCTPETPPLDLSEKVEPAWSVNLDSVSASPVVVDDAVLVYEMRGRDVFTLASYSAKDGSELWSHEASTGNVLRSASLSPTVVETEDGTPLIGMITPPVLADDRWDHTLQLLDPATGDVVAESPKLWASSQMFSCEGALCVGSWDYGTESGVDARLTPDGTFSTGVDLRRKFFDDSPSRALHEDLYLTVSADGAPLEFIVTDGDEILARTPADKLLPDFEGDARYVLAGAGLMEDENVIVVGSARSSFSDGEEELVGGDEFVSFAFDHATGELLWQRDGYLPCATTGSVFCTGDDTGFRNKKGTQTWNFESGATELVRLDPLTGEKEWSYKTDELAGFGNGFEDRTMLPPKGALAFTDAGVSTMISVDTGEAEPLKKGEYLRCLEQKTFLAPERSIPDRGLVLYDGAYVSVGCGPSGDITDAAEFTAGVVTTGAQAWLPRGTTREDSDQFYVLQTKDQLVGYQLLVN